MEPRHELPELSELLAHASWLRELVAPLLASPDLADDAVQETLAAAWAHPPHAPTRWKAWLASVVRRRALRLRRQAQRNASRESRVARPERVPAADEVVAAFELQTRLANAVLELEPMQRRAILLRYYEGRPPRAIAQELEVPVATVKTWLHRGLQALRARLERELGADWRGAFAPLAVPASLALPASTSGSSAALFLWGALMQAKLIVGALLIVGMSAVAWLATREAERPRIERSPSAEVRTEMASSALAASAEVPRVLRQEEPSESAANAVEPPRESDARASYLGRCVDEQGAPLAGVRVILSARPPSQRDRKAPEPWSAPAPLVTGADGVFDVRFEAASGYRFDLLLEPPERVRWQSARREIARGERVELGDILLERGCIVSGFVKEADGTPLARVQISALTPRSNAGPADAADRTPNADTLTRLDGSFTIEERLSRGTWFLEVAGKPLPEPHALEIQAGHLELFTEIRLPEKPYRPKISGVAVNEQGRPIPGATIRTNYLGVNPVYTQGDGSWTLEADNEASQPPSHLYADSQSHETSSIEGPIAWGTSNLRIVLRRGLDVSIAVRAAQGDQAIESFTIRLIADRANATRGGSDFAAAVRMTTEEHPGGELALRNIPRGRYTLQVDPTDRQWERSAPMLIEVRDSMTPIRVQLARAALLQVRVEDLEQRPRPGSQVYLVEPIQGAAFDERTTLQAFHSESFDSFPRAIIHDEGTTDESGAVALRATAHVPLALRVTGSSHLSYHRSDLLLSESTTLVVAVGGGARVVGRLGPPTILPPFRRAGGDATRGPSVQLVRTERDKREIVPPKNSDHRSRATHVLAEDGSFEIRGVPPGSWTLQLLYHQAHLTSVSGGPISVRTHFVDLGPVTDLRDGETRELVFERPDLHLACLRGQLFLDGTSFAHRPIQIIGRMKRPEAAAHISHAYAMTDGEGRFEIWLEAGHYQVQGRLPDPALDGTYDLPATTEVDLEAGGTCERRFDIRSGAVRLRLLDAAGAPVVGVRTYFAFEDSRHEVYLPRSDAEGRTRGRMISGTWIAKVGSPSPPHVEFALGSITVLEGTAEPEELTLRLPAEWPGG
ncbi:MAG: RNA polymerase sigma factor [Planctomycetes bacterium]|nr:RNA polymerase sigma factor [Planctomycetota bacterium]